MNQKRVSLLAPAQEVLSLGFPIFLVALTLLGIVIGRDWRRGISDDVLLIFTQYLFLNTIHNAFSLPLLIGLPEMRGWIRETTGGRPWLFWLRVVAFSIGVFAFDLILTLGPLRGTRWQYAAVIVEVLVIELWSIQHLVSQSKGLSLGYDAAVRRHLPLNEEETRRALRYERIERAAFLGLTVCACALTAIRVFRPDYWIERGWRLESVYYLPGPWRRPLLAAAGLSALACVLPLIINSLRSPQGVRSFKPLFLLRTLLIPMASLSGFSMYAYRAVHGLEYLWVYDKMYQSSDQSDASRRSWLAVTAAFGLLIAVLAVPRLFPSLMGAGSGPYPVWVQAVISASLSMLLLHFYLDSIMFRMREPAVRRAAGRLLAGKD